MAVDLTFLATDHVGYYEGRNFDFLILEKGSVSQFGAKHGRGKMHILTLQVLL